MKRISSLCYLFMLTGILSAQTLPLGQPVCSPLTDEYNPSVSGNGKTLIFEQMYRNATKPDIMISYQTNGVWSRPEIIPGANTEIDKIVNTGYFINHSGTIILFHSARYGGLGGSDIWMIEKTGTGGWSQPKNFAKPINSNLNEVDPSLSPDGKYLYFTVLSDKKTPSGAPCGTIMVSERLGKDIWKAPVAMPAPINTGCESNGKMLSDGKTFLFSSMRTGGKGGYDIYMTKQKEDGSWAEPLPYSFINTDKDDKYISVAAGGSMIYHHAPGKGTNERDIFRTAIPANLQPEAVRLYQGKVSADDGSPLTAQITVTNIQSGKQTVYTTSSDGSYVIPVSKSSDNDIGVFTVTPGYTYTSVFSKMNGDNKYEEIAPAFTLKKLVSPGASIPLNNLEFINNGIATDKKGELELARLKFFLKLNPTYKAEVRVHTNNVTVDTIRHSEFDKMTTERSFEIVERPATPTDTTSKVPPRIIEDTIVTTKTFYSNDHTAAQAKAIKDYLVQGGVTADRITANGYGNRETPVPASGTPVKQSSEAIIKW